MKKVLGMLMAIALTLVVGLGFSTPTSAATVKSNNFTQTLKYGKGFTIINEYQSATFGYAPIRTKTYFDASAKGISITSVSQSTEFAWPYDVAKKGTKVSVKSSAKSSQTAKSYGNFTVKYMKVPKLGASITTTDYRLNTYITVTKIDTKKKTVTVKVTRNTEK